MHRSYIDITSRIEEEPSWYTENAVPRYGEFNPGFGTGIYDQFAMLVRIGCQGCDKEFLIGVGRPSDGERPNFDLYDQDHSSPITLEFFQWTIEDMIAPTSEVYKSYHFGDPPNHGCVGDTMNCVDLEIVKVWKLNNDNLAYEWAEQPEYANLDIRNDFHKI